MNGQIEQMETQLEELPLFQKIILYITLMCLFFVASWYLFGEDISLKIESKQSSIISLEEELQKNSIPSLENKIKLLKKEILDLNDKTGDISLKLKFIQTKLEQVSFIVYDEKGTAEILDELLKNSLEHNINIKMIQTKDVLGKNDTYVIVKDSIKIIGSGSYKNIILLIQYIDALNALLRVEKISVKLDEDMTNFELDLLHYGVEL